MFFLENVTSCACVIESGLNSFFFFFFDKFYLFLNDYTLETKINIKTNQKQKSKQKQKEKKTKINK